jgi:hypothetical protein
MRVRFFCSVYHENELTVSLLVGMSLIPLSMAAKLPYKLVEGLI